VSRGNVKRWLFPMRKYKLYNNNNILCVCFFFVVVVVVVVEGFAPLVEIRMLSLVVFIYFINYRVSEYVCVWEREREREKSDLSIADICIIITVIVCIEKRETTKRVKINIALTGCRYRGISVRCKQRRGCCVAARYRTTTTIRGRVTPLHRPH